MGGINSANGVQETRDHSSHRSPLFIRLVIIPCILFAGHGPVLAQFPQAAGNRYELANPECHNIQKHQCAPCSQDTECLKGTKCCKVSGIGGCCSPLTPELAEKIPHHSVFSISRCPAGIFVKRHECIVCDKHHECPNGFGCCEVTNIGGCCLPLQTLKRARAAERRRHALQDRLRRKRRTLQSVCRSALLANEVSNKAATVKTKKTTIQRSGQPKNDISIKPSKRQALRGEKTTLQRSDQTKKDTSVKPHKRQAGLSEKITLQRSDQTKNDTSIKPNKRQAAHSSFTSEYNDARQNRGGYYSDNKKIGNLFQLGYDGDKNADSGKNSPFAQLGYGSYSGRPGLPAGENRHCPKDIHMKSWDCLSCSDNTECLNGFRCCPLPGEGGCCVDADKIVRGKMTVSSTQHIPNDFPIEALRSVYGANEFSMEISTEEYELPGVLSDNYYEENKGNSVCSSVGLVTRSTCYSCSDNTECIRGYECCDVPSIGGCCISK